MLAEKLNMSPEDAERWIVNLIRNAKLDAKIDSKQGTVVMGVDTNSPTSSSSRRPRRSPSDPRCSR
jgi:translation initiation factor 3 subunit E